jgi:hypothetical protein
MMWVPRWWHSNTFKGPYSHVAHTRPFLFYLDTFNRWVCLLVPLWIGFSSYCHSNHHLNCILHNRRIPYFVWQRILEENLLHDFMILWTDNTTEWFRRNELLCVSLNLKLSWRWKNILVKTSCLVPSFKVGRRMTFSKNYINILYYKTVMYFCA